jgi:hypothetical protein
MCFVTAAAALTRLGRPASTIEEEGTMRDFIPLTCDGGCRRVAEAHLAPASTVEAFNRNLHRALRRRGWKRTATGRWLCPQCWRREARVQEG